MAGVRGSEAVDPGSLRAAGAEGDGKMTLPTPTDLVYIVALLAALSYKEKWTVLIERYAVFMTVVFIVSMFDVVVALL